MYTHEPILFNIEKLARVYFRQNLDLAFQCTLFGILASRGGRESPVPTAVRHLFFSRPDVCMVPMTDASPANLKNMLGFARVQHCIFLWFWSALEEMIHTLIGTPTNVCRVMTRLVMVPR